MDLHTAHLPVHTVASHGQTRTAWTAQEDAILRARVAAIGAGAGLWPEVAKGLPGRTSKSCAERWQTHLNPAYVRSSEQEFSDWEIAVMILAYARHGSNWLKVSEYLPMRSPQNIKNQVNYFNAKPEHVRDNRYLAARIELEDLLATEPEIVKQRRETLRDVLLKGQSALPAGALQAAYAAAKLSPPNLGNTAGGRLHPYARPTSLQASYGIQAMNYQAAPQLQQQQQPQIHHQPQPQEASPPPMNAMMLLAQAACGADEPQDEPATAAAAAAAGAEGMVKVEQEEIQQASQHGVTGLQLPMIQTRPQHSTLQQKGSGGSSSSCKQPGSKSAQQMCYYPSALQNSAMSMMMPGLMMMQGAQGSPMASSEGHPMPASAAAALAAAAKQGTASPASTPLASLGAVAASAGLMASDLAAMAAAAAAAMPRPSKSGSSQGTRRRNSKAASKYEDFMHTGDDMSTSEEGEGEETGDLTPLAQRVAEAAAAAVSAATQQAVTATQQACQVLSMAQMLAQQAQQQEAKPAASDRSSQPSGVDNGSEQQMIESAVMQRLNNQMSNGDRAAGMAAAAAAAAAASAGNSAAHRLDDAVRHLLEVHYERMQKLQQQLQHELEQQLASLGKLA